MTKNKRIIKKYAQIKHGDKDHEDMRLWKLRQQRNNKHNIQNIQSHTELYNIQNPPLKLANCSGKRNL